MAINRTVVVLFLALTTAPGASHAQAPAPAAPADTARPAVHVVRRFPVVEVRAPLHDLRSSQTVRMLSGASLQALPVDGFAEAVALQAGVVAQGEELHVRGGRSGETAVLLDGLSLLEPHRHRAMAVPLLAVRSADLVSGAPEAQYGSGLAGTLDVRTVDPGERFGGEVRWQTALSEGDYDRVSARLGGPLHVLGLGVVAALDAALDDASLPDLRMTTPGSLAGLPFTLRADNRMAGYLALAPTDGSRRFLAQVLVARRVTRPYDPSWSLDGWTNLWTGLIGVPAFSDTPVPGYTRYRAADRLATTDERRLAAHVTVSTSGATRHASLGLGWLRTRAVRSVGGGRGCGYLYDNLLIYGDPSYPKATDPFHVIWGDDPLYRESGSDVFSLRGDAEAAIGRGVLKAGAGTSLEHVTLFELDGTAFHNRGLDSLRVYDARAPGGFAYVQGRWVADGLVANAGLRAEYFTAGHAEETQRFPGLDHGIWSFSPRLGLAYPLSVRDAFSLAYVRIQQNPGRDFLYDSRRVITNRQPLGNPALLPATVVSYEAAVKHLFSAEWVLQSSVFFRNIWGQVGTRNYYYRPGVAVPYYTNDDESSALGFEWALLNTSARGRRFEAQYTWMQAWGNESRPEGDPYGPTRGASIEPVTDVPLSWDRRHSLCVSGSSPFRHDAWFVSWSTVVGSPLPWTPKQLRQELTDFGLVNSRRLGWTESTSLDVRWAPRRARRLTLAFEVRNLFDERGERFVTVDGYPNPVINTLYDDYGAYRTETGQSGGAYWVPTGDGSGYWVPVNDPRLFQQSRTVRLSVGVSL